MILIDFNGVAMSAFHSQKDIVVEEGMLRHLVLNTIRGYNTKYRKTYGDVVVCVDANSWRKIDFEHYKAKRKKSRDESDVDWDEVFRVFALLVDEIKENLPWKVIKIWGCEADDIIGTLCLTKSEPTMIISNDGDFAQLQRKKNVKQFAPMKQKLVECKDPEMYLKEHILKGDSGDGIPNILSPDDIFLQDGVRQTALRKPRKEEIYANWDNLENVLSEEEMNNFERNEKLIDLRFTPDNLKLQILDEYENTIVAPNSKVLNYLIEKRCRNLTSSASDFFPYKYKKVEATTTSASNENEDDEEGLAAFM